MQIGYTLIEHSRYERPPERIVNIGSINHGFVFGFHSNSEAPPWCFANFGVLFPVSELAAGIAFRYYEGDNEGAIRAEYNFPLLRLFTWMVR